MRLNLHDFVSPDFWKAAAGIAFLKFWNLVGILAFFLLIRLISFLLVDRAINGLRARRGADAHEDARLRTLGTLIKSIVFYLLVFVSGYMVLRVFGADRAPVLTAAGVLGLALGFGAQKLVRDIISGFFILLENQYSVGDYVTIGAVTGEVQELGMRITRLKDDAGRQVILSNGDIAQVINHSRGPLLAVVDIGVAPDSDLRKVESAVAKAGDMIAEQVDGVLKPPRSAGIAALDSTRLTIRVTGEVKPGRQDAVAAALRESIREQFVKEDIRIV